MRTVTKVVDLTETAKKTKSIGKKNSKLGKKYSPNANESIGTTLRSVEPKLRLQKGKRSKIDLLRDPPTKNVSKKLRERY